MEHVARELDLNAYYSSHATVMDRMNVVPGLKTSAAFFIFLRANLVITPSAVSTPRMDPIPSPLVSVADDSRADAVPDDLPPLSVSVLSSESDKVDALRLVADSIAQQRQLASYHLVTHPYLLGALLLGLASAYQYSWRMQRDLGTAILMHSAVVTIYLLTIRYFTGQYIQIAEDLKWSWLVPPTTTISSSNSSSNHEDIGSGGSDSGSMVGIGDEDTVIGVRFGRDLIGALVLRLEPNPTTLQLAGRKRARNSQSALLKGGRGVIRAWTVKLKYRGQGVGRDMLNEAVKVTRERCGRDAEVGFAQEHANSAAVLPEMFNAPIRKGERRAAKSLEKLLGPTETAKGRRRSKSHVEGHRRVGSR